MYLLGNSSMQYMHSVYLAGFLNIGISEIMTVRMIATNETVGWLCRTAEDPQGWRAA